MEKTVSKSVNETTDNNEKFRSFKSKENIHKKEVGPSVTLKTWQKEPVKN